MRMNKCSTAYTIKHKVWGGGWGEIGKNRNTQGRQHGEMEEVGLELRFEGLAEVEGERKAGEKA